MLAALLLGCLGEAATDDTGAEDVTVLGPDVVTMDDEDGGLFVTVTGGTAAAWRFGFARVGFTSDGFDWEREGCLDSDDHCHTLGGGETVIDFGPEYCDAPEDGTTCMPRLFFRTTVLTYVIRPAVGVGCWTWGADTAPYEADGCRPMSWSGSSCAGC